MIQKPDSIDTLINTIKDLPSDPDLQNYKPDLLKDLRPDLLVVLNNQFFYITDLLLFKNIYVHKNLKNLLGHDPDSFKSMENIYRLIHPEDHDFVLAFTKKIITHSRDVCNDPMLIDDPYKTSFSIDFRIKKSNGQYKRVNRVTSCAKLDRKGNLVYAVSLFTDIDHIKQSNSISYSWSGDENGSFSVDDLMKEFPPPIFTKSEIGILKFLSKGSTAKQIAKELRISEHTVISHRKNMLRKSQTRNTAELIHLSLNKGLI